MRIVRIYSDSRGESHFSEDEVSLSPREFAPPAPPLNVSEPLAAQQMVFVGVPEGWHGDWHPAPRRQYWLGVSGYVDVTVSDGETRRFGPGSVLLLEDVTGKGHHTSAVGGQRVEGLFVQTPPE